MARRSVYYDCRGALNFYPLLHCFLYNFLLEKFREEKQIVGIETIVTTGQCEVNQILRKKVYFGCGRRFNHNHSNSSP